MQEEKRYRVITQAMREKYGLYSETQDEHFKQRVRAYLVTEKITATALSRQSDLASACINEMLKGTQFIHPRYARNIARVMGITEEELVGPESASHEPVLSRMRDVPRVISLLDHIGRKRQTQRRLAEKIDGMLTDVATLETEIDSLLLEVNAIVKGQEWIPDGGHHALDTSGTPC